MARTRKRSRKQFGSSPAIHTQQAAKASDEIQYAAVLTINKARNGRCTAATMAYADMQQAIGRYDAHIKSGGEAWKPASAIKDAAHDYNKHCVRDSSGSVAGRRRRRSR